MWLYGGYLFVATLTVHLTSAYAEFNSPVAIQLDVTETKGKCENQNIEYQGSNIECNFPNGNIVDNDLSTTWVSKPGAEDISIEVSASQEIMVGLYIYCYCI